MSRKVQKALIDAWINEEYPNAIGKLSMAAEIPVTSLEKIRAGRVPKGRDQRERLARVLGVTEAELFPVTAGESEAS